MVLFFIFVCGRSPLWAQTEEPKKTHYEIGAGYAQQIKINEAQASGTKLFLIHPQIQHDLYRFSPRRKLDTCQLVHEGLLGFSLHPTTNFIVGISEITRLNFKPKGRWSFFFDGGLGINAFSLRLPELGRKMEFSIQAGAGLKFRPNPTSSRRYIFLYRGVHFSDAGTVQPNQGINMNSFLVGINF